MTTATFPAGKVCAFVCLTLLVLVCLAYGRAQFLPFISDDFGYILLSRNYGAPSGWPALLQDALFRCRSTSILETWALDKIFGPNPLVFNLTDLALHWINTVLVACLGLWRKIGWKVSIPAAAFFAVAEGHQEAVIWFAASPELHVFAFVVSSFLCWIVWLQGERFTPGPYLASLGLFAIALFAKESAVALPGFLVLALGAERERRRAAWVALIPFGILSAVYFVLGYLARQDHLHYHDGTFSLTAPFPITLAISTARLIWFWGLSAAVTAIVLRWSQFRSVLAIGFFWMLVGLLPYSFLTYMNRVPSRHTYLASVGTALWVGAAAVSLHERLWLRRKLVLATVTLLVLAHNIGYLWTRKHRQFTERARPTEELIEVMRQQQGTVVIHCFPMHPIIPQAAVELMIGDAGRLRFPTGERCEDWKYSIEPIAQVE